MTPVMPMNSTFLGANHTAKNGAVTTAAPNRFAGTCLKANYVTLYRGVIDFRALVRFEKVYAPWDTDSVLDG